MTYIAHLSLQSIDKFTLDENNRFHPNNNYLMASPEERAKLIFPEDWELSEAGSLPGERKTDRSTSPQTEDGNLLYGDVWLLEQVAKATGLRDDLVKAFNGNPEMADAILSAYSDRYPFTNSVDIRSRLVMFQYRWQN